MPEHPNEPILEAILLNQDKNSKDHIQMLEHLLVQADNNRLDPLLEAQLVITDKIGKDIVQAIKEIPKTEIPEHKEVDLNETNKLLRELTDEVKKKEEYEVEIDANLKEKLMGQKGDKGEDGKNGVNGKDGKNGLDGVDGKDGKDGLTGPQGIPGKSLTKEDIDKISKGLNKTKKENFLFANSGVNSVIAGSNITIDNSNPQHPIISSSGGATGTDTFETVSKNLIASPISSTILDGQGRPTVLNYANGIIKTISYTDITITVVLSGSIPSGIDTTKVVDLTDFTTIYS